MKILLVENEDATRDRIEAYLQDGEYEVYTSGNGKHALDALSSGEVDLIISDTAMPEMDGVELLENVRANASTRDIPFLLCSSATEKEQIRRALVLGVAGYLRKPVDERDLLQTVRNVAELFGLNEERPDPDEPVAATAATGIEDVKDEDSANLSLPVDADDTLSQSIDFESLAQAAMLTPPEEDEDELEVPKNGAPEETVFQAEAIPDSPVDYPEMTESAEPTGDLAESRNCDRAGLGKTEAMPVTVVTDTADDLVAEQEPWGGSGWDDLAEPDNKGEPELDEKALDALFNSGSIATQGQPGRKVVQPVAADVDSGVEALFVAVTAQNPVEHIAEDVCRTSEQAETPVVAAETEEPEDSATVSEPAVVVSEESWGDSSSLPEAIDTARVKLKEMGSKIESGDYSEFEYYLSEMKKLAQRLDVTGIDESLGQTLANYRGLEKEELLGELLNIRSGIEVLDTVISAQ